MKCQLRFDKGRLRKKQASRLVAALVIIATEYHL